MTKKEFIELMETEGMDYALEELSSECPYIERVFEDEWYDTEFRDVYLLPLRKGDKIESIEDVEKYLEDDE